MPYDTTLRDRLVRVRGELVEAIQYASHGPCTVADLQDVVEFAEEIADYATDLQRSAAARLTATRSKTSGPS